MVVTLTPELEVYVAGQVASGRYASESDLIAELLREKVERDRKLADLRAAIDVGLEQVERGEVGPFDPRATLARVLQRQAGATNVPT